MSAILKFDFQKREQLRFSEVNYINYTKRPNFACGNYIFPKPKETRTSHGPIPHPLRSSTQIHPPWTLTFAFYPRAVAIWSRLPAGAVLHINPSVSHFQEFAVPAIMEMSPPAWLPCPVMLLPSLYYSAPYTLRKSALFWSIYFVW